MRIEIERLPIDAALEKYPPTQTMCVVINGSFYNDTFRGKNEQYDAQTLESAWMFTPQTWGRCKEWGNHCIAVIFTEETPAKVQEMIDAMPPLKRLSYELGKIKPKKPEDLCVENMEMQLEKYTLKKEITPNSLTTLQSSLLLTVSVDFRRLLTTEECNELDRIIKKAMNAFNSRPDENDANGKLTDAIINNLDKSAF